MNQQHSTAAAWDTEYRAGRYRDEPPVTFTQDILAAARETGPDRGLYIGCGNGRNYLPLVAAGLDLTGLDISAAAIAQLASRAPGRRDRLIRGDLTALPAGARSSRRPSPRRSAHTCAGIPAPSDSALRCASSAERMPTTMPATTGWRSGNAIAACGRVTPCASQTSAMRCARRTSSAGAQDHQTRPYRSPKRLQALNATEFPGLGGLDYPFLRVAASVRVRAVRTALAIASSGDRPHRSVRVNRASALTTTARSRLS
jgi:hypothetical protein